MCWHVAATFTNQSDVSAGSERVESAMACGSTMNIRDLELCSFIKFLTKKGKKLKQIHESMNVVYGDVSPSYYQVKLWSNQFKCGRESIEDDSRSGRPVEAFSKEMCQKLDMILQDCRVKISVIVRIGVFGVNFFTFSP